MPRLPCSKVGRGQCKFLALSRSTINTNDKSATSPQHKQVRINLARAKVRCVVSFPKFRYNDLLPTCFGLVGRVANKSATSPQQVCNFSVYGEVTGSVGEYLNTICI